MQEMLPLEFQTSVLVCVVMALFSFFWPILAA